MRDWAKQQIEAATAAPGKFHGQRKYPNVPCERDGEKFDSKHESGAFANLVLEHGRRNVIRQVSIPIGRKRVRPDFLIIKERFEDGSFRAELADAKGHATDAWEAKANHLEDVHGLKIRLIKQKGKG